MDSLNQKFEILSKEFSIVIMEEKKSKTVQIF
jgi:hypothetical protein